MLELMYFTVVVLTIAPIIWFVREKDGPVYNAFIYFLFGFCWLALWWGVSVVIGGNWARFTLSPVGRLIAWTPSLLALGYLNSLIFWPSIKGAFNGKRKN